MSAARTCEVYEIACVCGADPVEVPAALVDFAGTFTCEKCGRVARVQWAEARKA